MGHLAIDMQMMIYIIGFKIYIFCNVCPIVALFYEICPKTNYEK